MDVCNSLFNWFLQTETPKKENEKRPNCPGKNSKSTTNKTYYHYVVKISFNYILQCTSKILYLNVNRYTHFELLKYHNYKNSNETKYLNSINFFSLLLEILIAFENLLKRTAFPVWNRLPLSKFLTEAYFY